MSALALIAVVNNQLWEHLDSISKFLEALAVLIPAITGSVLAMSESKRKRKRKKTKKSR